MFKKFIKKVFSFFDPTVEPQRVEIPEFELTPAPPKPTRDYSRFTQYQYDYICRERIKWEENNRNKPRAEREPLNDLIARLNDKLGMNKSLRSYHRVWTGALERDSLPEGTPCFAY
jgi:hypothetical protein